LISDISDNEGRLVCSVIPLSEWITSLWPAARTSWEPHSLCSSL